MNTVKGYRVYINQDNELLPSNTFFDVVGYINNELYTGGDVISADNETSQYYLVIYYEEDYFAIECLPYSGFNPKNKITDFSEVRWLTHTNLGDFPEIGIVYDFGLYQTKGVELTDTLPEEVLQSFRDCRYASYYEFDQTIQDDKIYRVQYKLVDYKNYVKSLFNKININSTFEQTQFLHLEFISTQKDTQLILNNIFIRKSNSQNYLQNQVSTNGLNIDITLDDILDVGTYNIIIPQQNVFLFGPNGQVEYNNKDKIIKFSVVQSGNDQGQTDHEITLYNKLLKIQNNSLNINNFVKRLLGTDTIIIKKDSNYNITLKPILCKTTQGSVSEDVPITDVSTVLLTYSFYQDEVLISHNVQIQYNQDLDLLDMIQDLNVDYIKILVQFNYKQTLIQQGFELYFVNADIYQYITTNQEYVLEGSIDMSNGQPAVTRCGCLLLTNRYDVYETFETIENEQTVIKGVADIVPNTKVRMGNLTGIHNYKFGTNQPRGYGLYGESVYLTGNFYLNNGRSLVDIDRDILFANGNIREVQRLLESLDNSIRATIEANSTIVEASYLGAISTNNNALLRLGLDYSLWALGNAGIVLINPNATYTGTGEVDPGTVGDGDESILLQGENIKFATNNTVTIDGVVYHEMICSRTSPASWEYNGNIYLPSNLNNNFFIAYISGNVLASCQNVHFDRAENQVSQEYLKYVAFNYIPVTATQDSNLNPPYKPTDFGPSLGDNAEYYLFNNCYLSSNLQFKLKISENVYTQNDISNTINGNIYLMPRVKVAGMFKNGKFNADLIETKNILAYDEQTQANGISKYRKNPEFSFNDPVSDQNYPVQSQNDQGVWETDKTAPFAVISGETGRISTQGVDLREAKVEQENGNQSIHIVNNDGFKEPSDPTADYPAIYFKKGDEIRTKISSIGQYTSNDRPVKYYEIPQEVEEFNITTTGDIGTNTNDFKEIKFENFKLNRILYNSNGEPISDNGSIVEGGAQQIYDKFEQSFTVKLTGNQLETISGGRYKLNNGSYTSFTNLSSNELTISNKVRYNDVITLELDGVYQSNEDPEKDQAGDGPGPTGYSIRAIHGKIGQFTKTASTNKTIIILSKFRYVYNDDGVPTTINQVTNYTVDPNYESNGIITIEIGPREHGYSASYAVINIFDGRQYLSGNASDGFNFEWYLKATAKANLVNSQVSAVRYAVDSACTQSIYNSGYNFYSDYDSDDPTTFEKSDCRKFIKIIKKFTVKAGQSKQISLKQAKADFYLNESAIQNFMDSSGTNQTNVSSTNEFKAFAGYLSLISGFRVSWITSTSQYHSDHEIYTTNYKLNHKWLSQQNCIIKRDKYVELVGGTKEYLFGNNVSVNELLNKEYSKNSIDIINNSNQDETYYLEYAVLLYIDNEYDIDSYIITNTNDSSINPGSIIGGMETPHSIIVPVIGFIGDTYSDSDNFKNPSVESPSSYSSLTSENWHPAQAPITYDFSDTNEHKTRVILKGYQISIFDNKFQTNLQGNGLGLGVNQNNYFGTYLIQNQSSSVNFNLLSCGNGLSFSENGFQNILSGRSINRFIPILQGKIQYKYYSIPRLCAYNFNGISLMDTNSDREDIFTFVNTPLMVMDEYNSIPNDTTWTFYSTYSYKHDLYILRDYSSILIIFGESWNQLFNKFGFDEDQVFVYLNGINQKNYSNANILSSQIIPSFKGVKNYLEEFTQTGLLLTNYKPNNNYYDTPTDITLLDPINASHFMQINIHCLSNTHYSGDFHISLQYSPKFQS